MKKERVIVITGAGGVLCGEIARFFAMNGDKVALIDKNGDSVCRLASELNQKGFTAKGYEADVLNKASLESARDKITADLGACTVLINGAGGNNPMATTDSEMYEREAKSFFELTKDGVDFVFNLNFMGTFLTTQVFAKSMADKKSGAIINISSMNAFAPLTKIPAYSASKAGVSNFTQWLAVYFAKSGIRVNAIAPGFFATAQNKTLLFNQDGSLTARSDKILKNTPMGRFGEAKELLGAVDFLANDSESGFVTGVVLPVDGGFSAFSGV
ncbi:MAG: SDR family oxidoreductase [Firmicutes bacterium]|nr:SDR family oxidoreductase [Bacillota bacterium]